MHNYETFKRHLLRVDVCICGRQKENKEVNNVLLPVSAIEPLQVIAAAVHVGLEQALATEVLVHTHTVLIAGGTCKKWTM